MNNLSLNLANVQEMDVQEMEQIEGGLFPIVILGVTITAKGAAWATAAGIFAAGVYAGLTE